MATQGNYLPDSKFKLRPSELYIACMDMDFSWYPAEVDRAISLYNAGASLVELAQGLDRDGDETFILLLDLARRGKIQAREGGWCRWKAGN